jgi:hypothetical protein
MNVQIVRELAKESKDDITISNVSISHMKAEIASAALYGFNQKCFKFYQIPRPIVSKTDIKLLSDYFSSKGFTVKSEERVDAIYLIVSWSE